MQDTLFAAVLVNSLGHIRKKMPAVRLYSGTSPQPGDTVVFGKDAYGAPRKRGIVRGIHKNGMLEIQPHKE